MRGTDFVFSGPGVSRWRTLKAYALWQLSWFVLLGILARIMFATFTSQKTAKEILETMHGVAESWKYEHEKCYLVLLTGTPGPEVTIKKIKEKECKVTNYARFQITNGVGKKLKFGETGSSEYAGYVENEGEWEIQSGLTGSNEAITYWATVTGASGEEGKPIAWGSCTSTEIGGTGTPVKVASGKYLVKLS